MSDDLNKRSGRETKGSSTNPVRKEINKGAPAVRAAGSGGPGNHQNDREEWRAPQGEGRGVNMGARRRGFGTNQKTSGGFSKIP